MKNLNECLIPSEDGGVPLGDWDLGLGDVYTHFRNLKPKLLAHIIEADYVFGCVAWLTDPDILHELSKKRGVCILIQKEDFLRPDGAIKDFHRKIYDAYHSLPSVSRLDFRIGLANDLSRCGDPTMEPVRVVGFKNKGPYGPRMHHKFALFAQHNPNSDRWDFPHTVWTGSFNWTKSASNSLENAVVFRETKAVKGYYLEFQQVLGLSEPPDWTSEYVAPQWRIGS